MMFTTAVSAEWIEEIINLKELPEK